MDSWRHDELMILCVLCNQFQFGLVYYGPCTCMLLSHTFDNRRRAPILPRDDPASGVTVFCTHRNVGYIKVNRAVWGSPVVWGPGSVQKQARLGLGWPKVSSHSAQHVQITHATVNHPRINHLVRWNRRNDSCLPPFTANRLRD